MIKKIVKLMILVSIFITILACSVVNAASAVMGLEADKTSGKVGDTVSVYFSLQSFREIEGLMAIGGYVNYDKSILEYKSISGLNGWSDLNYNKSNGSFLAMQYDLAKQGNVFKITFAIKGEPASGTTTISITGIDATDGERDDISTSNVSTTIKILKTEENKEEEKEENDKVDNTNKVENNDKVNNEEKENNTTEEKKDTTSSSSNNKDKNVNKNKNTNTNTNKNDNKKTNTEQKDTNTVAKEQSSTEKEDTINTNEIKSLIEEIKEKQKEDSDLREMMLKIRSYSIVALKWIIIGICITTLIVALIVLKKSINEGKTKKKND